MKSIIFLVMTALILWVVPAQATFQQRAAYIAAYADAKPKCLDCHVDKMPKKDGPHDLNAYGAAVMSAAKAAGRTEPIAADYTTVGTIEDFAKKAATK